MEIQDELASFCEVEFPRLVGLLSLYCGDRGVAEEIAQETLVRICAAWPKPKQTPNPSAWTSRVAINLTNSFFRRRAAERRARIRLASGETQSPHVADLAEVVAVREAIAGLPRRYKTALVLHYYLDLTLIEVASAMDVPEGTAKTWCRRAIQRLRSDIDSESLKEWSSAY